MGGSIDTQVVVRHSQGAVIRPEDGGREGNLDGAALARLERGRAVVAGAVIAARGDSGNGERSAAVVGERHHLRRARRVHHLVAEAEAAGRKRGRGRRNEKHVSGDVADQRTGS